MVESTQAKAQADEEEQTEKNFIEDPAILDKFKAAAVITDGRNFICFSFTT